MQTLAYFSNVYVYIRRENAEREETKEQKKIMFWSHKRQPRNCIALHLL